MVLESLIRGHQLVEILVFGNKDKSRDGAGSEETVAMEHWVHKMLKCVYHRGLVPVLYSKYSLDAKYMVSVSIQHHRKPRNKYLPVDQSVKHQAKLL